MRPTIDSIAIGDGKGFKTQVYEKSKSRNSYAKGKLSKKTAHVRALIKEVAGVAPYEKRLIDLIKTGGASSDKKAYKFAKRRLGTHQRALKKREMIKAIIENMKRKHH